MIQTGIKNRLETVSTQNNSAESLGSGNVPVFATISMIGLIGEGTHERFIIDKERFISKTYAQ